MQNKYIAHAPNMQATQQQRMGMVNQGVRSTVINFQAAPPSAPAKEKKAVVEGKESYSGVSKWALVTIAMTIAGQKYNDCQSTKSAPLQKTRFGKK